MKMSNLPEEGLLTLVSGVLGFIALLMMFSCTTGTSSMSCDNLLAEERDSCLQEIKQRNENFRYQMETRGTMQ